MVRIGFVGTENSHVQHFIRFLNSEGRHPGIRGAALAGGLNDRNQELAQAGNIDLIVDAPADLVGHVDAAIVSTRDGAKHLEHARPLLAAGLPVLVDKPLAASVEDAEALIAIAQQHNAPLLSASALRFVPEMADLRVTEAQRGQLRHLHVVGPADPDSEYSGLFFYGIHHVETALEILGNPEVAPGSVSVTSVRAGDTTVASCRIAGIQVTFTFITPQEGRRVPFYAMAVHTDAVIARELTLSPDYNAPSLERFVDLVEHGTNLLTPPQLLSPISLLSEVVSDLERNQS